MEHPDTTTPISNPLSSPRTGGMIGQVIAWATIIAAVVAVIVLRNLPDEDQPDETEAGIESAETRYAPADPVGLAMTKLQSRMLVGMGDSRGEGRAFDTGTPAQRLRMSAVLAHTGGREAGLASLNRLREALERQWGDLRIELPTEEPHPDGLTPDVPLDADGDAAPPIVLREGESRTLAILQRLYEHEAIDGPAGLLLSDEERALLRRELGWFGDLALWRIDADPEKASNEMMTAITMPGAPSHAEMIRPAERVRNGLFMVVGFGLLGLLAGFALLVTLIVFVFLGKATSGLPDQMPHHGVYVETFAVWMLLFFGLLQLAALAGRELAMLATAGAFFASLLALGWPVLRGVAWSRVRHDIGWRLGTHPLREMALGPVGYLMCLPLMGVGMMLTIPLVLATREMTSGSDHFLGSTQGPAHPIIGEIGTGTLWTMLHVYLVAAVAAPIVEETFFRGVFYAHLRAVSRRLGLVASIAVGMVVNTFIFAVIHPQGFVAVPLLMSLAIGMTMLREWRGSLLPSILIHGISNGLVMTLLMLAVGMD